VPVRATCICARSWSAPPFRQREPKASYLRDKFHRLKARRGALRAALAIAHKIVVAAYHMLAKGVAYRDLGDAYLDQIGERRTVANLKRRLERLGYHVALEPRAEAA
jgi:transposase